MIQGRLADKERLEGYSLNSSRKGTRHRSLGLSAAQQMCCLHHRVTRSITGNYFLGWAHTCPHLSTRVKTGVWVLHPLQHRKLWLSNNMLLRPNSTKGTCEIQLTAELIHKTTALVKRSEKTRRCQNKKHRFSLCLVWSAETSLQRVDMFASWFRPNTSCSPQFTKIILEHIFCTLCS